METDNHNIKVDAYRAGAQDVEQLLIDAGFDFTVVAHCPDPRCTVCNRKRLSVAA